MPDPTDYYDILGVSPSSDDVVIRAAYKALMLKYHPDTNKGADATRRAAAINAAFAVLGDPDRRAAYDAHRPTFKRSPPPPPPPSPSPAQAEQPSHPPRPDPVGATPTFWGKWGGFIGIVVIIVLIRGAFIYSREHRLADSSYDNTMVTDMNTMEGMDTMTDNMTAVDAAVVDRAPIGNTMMSGDTTGLSEVAPSLLGGLGTSAFQPATALQFQDIEGAAITFEKVLNRGGIIGARAWSQDCHRKVDANPSWAAADRCAAFDYAARYIDAAMVKAADIAPQPYFIFQADNQADNYKVVGGQPYALRERLNRISSTVEPITAQVITAVVERRQRRRATMDAPVADDQASGNDNSGD